MDSLGQFPMMFGDSDSTMLAVLVFLAAATLAFCVMAAVQIDGSVSRRAAGLNTNIEQLDQSRSLRGSSFRLAQKVLEQATKHYASTNEDDLKVLRSRMVKAGIFDPRAVGFFFVGRTILAIGLAAAIYFFAPVVHHSTAHWLLLIVGGIG